VPDRSAEPGTVAIESLACGVPVLAIDFGSSSGLIDGSAMKGIACDLAPAPGAAAGLKWADPSRESLRKALREAFEGSEDARAKALDASEGIRFQRSWDEVARLMKERLDAIARR